MLPVSDATSLAAALGPLVPLRIEAVEFYSGGLLTVIGERWSLNFVGEWAWRRQGVLVTGGNQPGAEDVVWDLCGVQLLGANFPDASFDGNCTFVLSDGTLDAMSDGTGWETWVFRHVDLDNVFVGL